MYTAVSNKKKKIYSDGILRLRPKQNCELYSMENKSLGKVLTPCTLSCTVDQELKVGRQEVEIQAPISAEDFHSKACFEDSSQIASEIATERGQKQLQKAKTLPVAVPKLTGAVAPADALVLWPASESGQQCDVFVDRKLQRALRPHQIEGVQFLFDCVAKQKDRSGAILADHMGLGKTLQSICLLHTMLFQNGPQGRPLGRKAMIVCPSSLVENWRTEFHKWLGALAARHCLVLEATSSVKTQIADFVNPSTRFRIMILSYEIVAKYSDLAGAPVDLIIADEGHRLKSDGTKTIQALKRFNTQRRVILTGTPIQNNLDEFWTIANFCCPDYFGSAATFKAEFTIPISKMHDPSASATQQEHGKYRSEQLQQLNSQIMLRRESHVNLRYLTCGKTTSHVFCEPSAEQIRVCEQLLESRELQQLFQGEKQGNVLNYLSRLQQICNHPSLQDPSALKQDPAGFMRRSGKTAVLAAMITEIVQSEELSLIHI
eukprot:TRINITY_DN30223_c0_g2_i1.p1 TRINITY_DN30223_c0_g2~~TRINITY_DN30223_c0_g2_i1.p1  ORF type:complete len:489 (-),score=58.53 TRINITY_DN30223_c0_g2_i1:134-1600(-)